MSVRALSVLMLILLAGVNASAQRRFGVDGTPEKTPEKSENSRRFGVDAPATTTTSARNLRYFPTITNNSRRFGLPQVGEASLQAVRATVAKPALSGPEALVAKADKLVDDGEPQRALELYHKALESSPQLLSARFGLGYAHIAAGDFALATQELIEALQSDPDNGEGRLNLGIAYYRQGNFDDAIKEFDHALARKEQQSTAHYNLAAAYAHQGDFEKAIAHYRSAIEARKNYPEACNNLGLIYEAMDNYDGAGEQFRIAIEQRKGRYPLAHYNLARFYCGQKKYDEALTEFQLAIKQQANFAEAYLDLGNLYLLRTGALDTNEIEPAIAAYRQAIALRPDNYPLAHENLAIALTKQGQKQAAIAEYRAAFEQYDGQCPETLKNLISTLLDKRVFLVGNELSRSENPTNLKREKDLSKVTARLQAALEKYEEMDDELKEQADVRYCAGRAYAAVGDWKSAADEFARAIELSGKKDQEAAQALNAVLELVQYF